MIAALTPIKNVLDPYLMPLEGPTRAYNAGRNIHYYYHDYLDADHVTWRNAQLFHTDMFKLFIETLSTFSLILEANRLKIFKGRHWEILFFGSTLGGIAFLNVLAFASKYFKRELPPLLDRISKASWQNTPAIKGVTNLVFTIFEFHRRPKEIAFCLLGGYVDHLVWSKETSEAVKWKIDKIQHCIHAVRFYVGFSLERTLIWAFYAYKFT